MRTAIQKPVDLTDRPRETNQTRAADEDIDHRDFPIRENRLRRLFEFRVRVQGGTA
jgi:hypothetical protein